jgi:hypothetical protein
VISLGRVKLAVSGGFFVALLLATVGEHGARTAPSTTQSSAAEVVTGNAGEMADPVARGRALFQAKGCLACHRMAGLSGSAQVGPDLSAVRAVAATRRPGLSAEAYVRESLVEPQAYVVPGYGASPTNPGSPAMPKLALAREEVESLIAFLLADPAGR